ncbi:hypothetical protein [Frigoriglobus tundricola]|uniref:Uncharacterized protein n=1 Tax=Frigoriglobus tundricola TaxID=2774151 RepID=A0A6M5Z659_9BACT|nr:hypothetical protein [Frigoriglobus tundricola]QJX01347.1 hypothetical protein FTUN_8991 [Frigoriglobus tundricola]
MRKFITAVGVIIGIAGITATPARANAMITTSPSIIVKKQSSIRIAITEGIRSPIAETQGIAIITIA